MKIESHSIETRKTAKLCQLGEWNAHTDSIWLVLHGYGQLAERFIQNFEPIADEKTIIIAPEALSRFYWNGFGGKPVACWMTSESRETEIGDYVYYLDQVYKQMIKVHRTEKMQFNVLGFSQGTATASRWMAQSEPKVDHFLSWAGPLAHDILWEKATPVFRSTKRNIVLMGNEDPFLNEERKNKLLDELKRLDFPYEKIEFDGKHEITESVLVELAKSFKTNNEK